MSFLKRLFGGGKTQSPNQTHARRETAAAPTPLSPATDSRSKPRKPPSEPIPETTNRDRILQELEKFWATSGDEARAIERKLVNLGPMCLQLLKAIARDSSVKLHLRKAAIACAVTFDDENKAAFLAEFVNGKNPAALYAAYDNGNSKAGEEFGLFRTAKEYLEKMGHKFTITPP